MSTEPDWRYNRTGLKDDSRFCMSMPFKIRQCVIWFVLVSSASPFPWGVCSSVQYDSGGVWPAGSVEEKRAQEAGTAVLIGKRKCLRAVAIKKNLFHCHGWEPVVDLLVWKTKSWSHRLRLLARRGQLYARTVWWPVLGCFRSNHGCVLEWCVSNRDCSTVVLCFP